MDQVKTTEYIFKILDEAIQEVGEENVVHVVTDNASNCVGARKMLMEKHKTIYWTPCAAHYLDLLLDLAKFPWINENSKSKNNCKLSLTIASH
jgi:tryptophanase